MPSNLEGRGHVAIGTLGRATENTRLRGPPLKYGQFQTCAWCDIIFQGKSVTDIFKPREVWGGPKQWCSAICLFARTVTVHLCWASRHLLTIYSRVERSGQCGVLSEDQGIWASPAKERIADLRLQLYFAFCSFYSREHQQFN